VAPSTVKRLGLGVLWRRSFSKELKGVREDARLLPDLEVGGAFPRLISVDLKKTGTGTRENKENEHAAKRRGSC